ERVQDVDGLHELRDVEHPMLSARVYADLLHTKPDARHRLPVVRIEPALCTPQLKSSNLPSILRESPDRFSGIPSQTTGFSAMPQHTRTYILSSTVDRITTWSSGPA